MGQQEWRPTKIWLNALTPSQHAQPERQQVAVHSFLDDSMDSYGQQTAAAARSIYAVTCCQQCSLGCRQLEQEIVTRVHFFLLHFVA